MLRMLPYSWPFSTFACVSCPIIMGVKCQLKIICIAFLVGGGDNPVTSNIPPPLFNLHRKIEGAPWHVKNIILKRMNRCGVKSLICSSPNWHTPVPVRVNVWLAVPVLYVESSTCVYHCVHMYLYTEQLTGVTCLSVCLLSCCVLWGCHSRGFVTALNLGPINVSC